MVQKLVSDAINKLKPKPAPKKTASAPVPKTPSASKTVQKAGKPYTKKPKTPKRDVASSKPPKTPPKTTGRPISPAKLREYSLILGKIYAYKPSGDCIEYKDLFIASEKLGVDPTTLYRIIKSNSNAIEGLMFTSDSDY